MPRSLPLSTRLSLPVCLVSLSSPQSLWSSTGSKGEWKAFCRLRAGSSPSAVLWGEANWCTFWEAASVQLLETLTLIVLSQLLVYNWNCCYYCKHCYSSSTQGKLCKTITIQRAWQLQEHYRCISSFKRFFVLTCCIRAFSLKMLFAPQNVYNIQYGMADNLKEVVLYATVK